MPRRIITKRAGSGISTDPFVGETVVATQAFEYYDLLESTGHQVSLLGKSPDDLGGEFLTVSKQLLEGVANASNPLSVSGGLGPSYQWTYNGVGSAYLSSVDEYSYPSIPFPSIVDIDAWGASAIAATIPTNPLSGLAAFLGELHEGLPHLFGADFFKSRIGQARAAGSEYLNYEFGWKPLVSDLRKFASVVKNVDKLILQYEQNSGKRLKRRFYAPIDEDRTEEDLGLHSPSPPMPTYVFSGSSYQGPLKRITTKRHERWFSGCFTYYLEPFKYGQSNFKRNSQIANKLLGTRLTPEVVWQLTPWSWAADWFGNFHSVIHNVVAFANDGLVMPYGYVMDKRTTTVSYVLSGIRFESIPDKEITFYQDFITTMKYRRRATPFGFGLSFEGLTDRQKAIATAIGVTRGQGKR